ncbi:hypothetical protein ES703_117990 [subsurface metagenome]
MALIKFGGGITEMRGSIAGNVYSRNRYGAYARARTKPINPNTARQQAVRAAVAALTVRWSSTLTSLQRTAWDLYASNVPMKNKLGETIYLSGFNHYIRSNTALMRGGISTIDAGPVIFELPDQDPLLSFTASEATSQATVTFDDGFAWCSEDDAWMEIYAGKPQNPQRNFFDGPWRVCGFFPGDSGAPVTTPQDVGYQFQIAQGQHLWIYARIRRADGRLSERFRADTFCAP